MALPRLGGEGGGPTVPEAVRSQVCPPACEGGRWLSTSFNKYLPHTSDLSVWDTGLSDALSAIGRWGARCCEWMAQPGCMLCSPAWPDPEESVLTGALCMDTPSPSKEARQQSHFIYLLWMSLSPSQPLGGAHGFNPCVRRARARHLRLQNWLCTWGFLGLSRLCTHSGHRKSGV